MPFCSYILFTWHLLLYHLICYPLCCHHRFVFLLQPSPFLPDLACFSLCYTGLPCFSLFSLFYMSLFWFLMSQVILVRLEKGEIHCHDLWKDWLFSKGLTYLCPQADDIHEKREIFEFGWCSPFDLPMEEKEWKEKNSGKNTFTLSFYLSFIATLFFASIPLFIKTSQF